MCNGTGEPVEPETAEPIWICSSLGISSEELLVVCVIWETRRWISAPRHFDDGINEESRISRSMGLGNETGMRNDFFDGHNGFACCIDNFVIHPQQLGVDPNISEHICGMSMHHGHVYRQGRAGDVGFASDGVGFQPRGLGVQADDIGAQTRLGRDKRQIRGGGPQARDKQVFRILLQRHRSGFNRVAEVGGKAHAFKADQPRNHAAHATRRHQPVDSHAIDDGNKREVFLPLPDQFAHECHRRGIH